MPHVVLEGPITLDGCRRLQVPFVERDGERIVKVDRFYADTDGRAALLETLVVDRGHTQRFFIQLALRDGGLIVRLEPMTDPEKTAAVKRALAIVAHRLVLACGARYGSTNIPEHLLSGPRGGGRG